MSNINELDENKLFELYTLAELAYQKYIREIIDNKQELFPEGCYKNKNYKLKIEILTEAIKNNVLIENTTKYVEIIEEVGSVLVKGQKNQ